MTNIFDTILLSYNKTPFQPINERNLFEQMTAARPKDYVVNDSELADFLAFNVLENYTDKNSSLGRFFKPVMAWPTEDGGMLESPSLADFTESMVQSWMERKNTLTHPVLLARYFGLLYDIAPQITKKPVDFSTRKNFFDNLQLAIKEDLLVVNVYKKEKAKHLLELALTTNNQTWIDEAKKTMMDLEDKIAIDGKAGLWGFCFDNIWNSKKKIITEAEEAQIILDLESRLARMITDVDASGVEACVERLATYYNVRRKPDEIKRVLNDLRTCYNTYTKELAAIQKAHFIEKVARLFRQYGFVKEDAELLAELREVNKIATTELKLLSTTNEISKEEIKEYCEKIFKGEKDVLFYRFIAAQTPKIADIASDLARLAKINPMSYMITKGILDDNGRKIGSVKPLSEDLESNIVFHLSRLLKLSGVLLHFLFEYATEQKIFTVETMMTFLKKSCIIKEDRFSIIQLGIDAYFQKNYVVAIHLLIPQVEEALRNLVEMNGGTIMVAKQDAFHLKTFDHILKDGIIADVLGEDKTKYFQVLFTNPIGWNLRNNVCHGMLDSAHFSRQQTERLLHALLCLGMIRLTEEIA